MSNDARGWNQRPDISEELIEQRWKPHSDYWDMIWTKGDCVFTLIDRSGRSQLENRREGYTVLFTARTPAFIVLANCDLATAPCQEHGPACAPNDHVKPPTVKGEVT
ncbi:hypothetical protein OG497_37725 [Streptomyces sp. NBC_01242]|uniref:hypothetical protein n=1 Tax=Streptomyces sp. NBC_01242 TaxID=2903795 RepID=UPI00225B6115|nr:hypothetical protein [Streptomyces sp. NBC_01242]MCX4799598.1 hypothetical protein [Streptomyces sp. NBC_01242]